MHQLFERVMCMHDLGYVHSDIKPDNVCLNIENHNLVVYLIDYGLATKFQQ